MPEELQNSGDLLEQDAKPPVLDGEVGESSTPEGGTEPAEETVPWFKKRINSVTAQKYRAEQEAAELRGKVEALEKMATAAPRQDRPKPVESVADLGPPPKEDDFDNYNDYLEARDTRNRNIAKFEAVAEFEARQAEEKRKEKAEQQLRSFRDWSVKGAEQYPDFEEVALRKDIPYTDAMREAVLALDDSHRVAYFLGQNPQEAARLANLPYAKAVLEIARIDTKLAQNKPRTISNAPGPIKPLEPVTAGSTDLYDPNLDMKDFAKLWKEKNRR